MVFNTPINDRYLEDYVKGDIHRLGSIAVEKDEVIAFAQRFDPQSFHVNQQAARLTPFGGIIASLGSPGIDELRWLKPVRPGDTLSARVIVLEAVRSKSKPDRGAITSLIEVSNQAGEVVMTFKCVNIIRRRPSR